MPQVRPQSPSNLQPKEPSLSIHFSHSTLLCRICLSPLQAGTFLLSLIRLFFLRSLSLSATLLLVTCSTLILVPPTLCRVLLMLNVSTAHHQARSILVLVTMGLVLLMTRSHPADSQEARFCSSQ